MIALTVNGAPREMEPGNLASLLERLAIDTSRRGLAVAVNGAVVRRADWPRHRLAEGDRVEIVRPLQGG